MHTIGDIYTKKPLTSVRLVKNDQVHFVNKA